jgi:hypothetical protein
LSTSGGSATLQDAIQSRDQRKILAAVAETIRNSVSPSDPRLAYMQRIVNQEQEKAEDCTKDPSLPWETKLFTCVVRCQLTTSANKTDVYIAQAVKKTGSILLVVKGPFARAADADRAVALYKWKRAHGMPAIPARKIMMIPDRWPGGVPLGVRNKLPRDEPAPFLVTKCMIDMSQRDTIPAKDHGPTKKWPITQVVNWDNLPHHQWKPTHLHHTPQEKFDWVVALVYRKVMGIGDLADRNFFCAGGRVYSLDEDAQPRDIDVGASLRKARSGIAVRWLQQYWDKVRAAVASWAPDLTADQGERLTQIMAAADPGEMLL